MPVLIRLRTAPCRDTLQHPAEMQHPVEMLHCTPWRCLGAGDAAPAPSARWGEVSWVLGEPLPALHRKVPGMGRDGFLSLLACLRHGSEPALSPGTLQSSQSCLYNQIPLQMTGSSC